METIFLEHDDRRFWDLKGDRLAGDGRGLELVFGDDCMEATIEQVEQEVRNVRLGLLPAQSR
jgi:hypothetical protein